jgi:ABC-type multidrug transport system ATPase subunit
MFTLPGGCWQKVLSLFLLSHLILSCDGVAAKTTNDTMSSSSGLVWHDLSVQTADGAFLLHPSQGFVPSGHVCGVIGPSGAGKTSFLSSLGGTICSSSGLQVNGEVLYHNVEQQMSEHLQVNGGQVAWLQQKDVFFNTLTVREVLELAAFLELPHDTGRQRSRRVQVNMDSLGLTKLQHRRIGESAWNNGLSGGEQRRLSLALELIGTPKLFIADEPTSGLDSTLSEKVMKLIKKLVQQRQIPCLLSLHQPRSSIFRMLDSVLLMAPGGRICYFGGTEASLKYFSDLGYECPEETNPAEFLLDLVSVDSEDPYTAIEDEARITNLVATFAARRKKDPIYFQFPLQSTKKGNGVKKNGIKRHPFRFIQRFSRLLLRSWRQNIRNHRVNAIRLLLSAGNAYLFSNIFRSIQKDVFSAKSVADRTAILTFGVINMSMMALMKTIDLFAKEKPVVKREQQRNQYSSIEYLLSKVFAEIPLDAVFAAIFTTVLKKTTGLRIGWKELTATFSLMTVSGASLGFVIGSLSPTAELAMSAGVPLMVILMSVGVINPSGVADATPPPAVVGLLKELSPIAYAVKAVCLAEYTGMEFDSNKNKSAFARGRGLVQDLPKMGAFALVRNGQQVLHELGLSEDTYGGAMKHLAILSAVNLLISWIGLSMQSSVDFSATKGPLPL